MAKNATDKLVIGRVLLQDQSRSEVAELMRRHSNAELLGDAVDDLTAQRPLGFVPVALTGKEPGIISAAQPRPEH